MDFGSVFDGTGLWLEAAVRPGSSTGGYTILSPRQEITPAPYALYASSPVRTSRRRLPALGGSGAGVYGTGSYGVYGTSATLGGSGVYGTGYYGIYGTSATLGGSGAGVYGTGHFGVYGLSDEFSGYGGYFVNTAGGVAVSATGSGIIESTADTQIVVSPFDLRAWSGGVSATPDDQGYVYLQASASGSQEVLLPVTLPARVFGVPQKLKSIKVCYQLDNASSYIDKTEAYYYSDSGVLTYLFRGRY